MSKTTSHQRQRRNHALLILGAVHRRSARHIRHVGEAAALAISARTAYRLPRKAKQRPWPAATSAFFCCQYVQGFGPKAAP
jgi:hypothetical protein